MTAYFAITLLTNISISALLIGRILWVQRTIRTYRAGHRAVPKGTRRAVRVVMQSETAYSVAVVFNLAAYLARSELVFITFASLPSLVGISFTLMITSIGLNELVAAPSAPSLSEIVVAVQSPLATLTTGTAGPAPEMMHEWELPLHFPPVDLAESICNFTEEIRSSEHCDPPPYGSP
ncbi:hypothetical protein C8Q77DRAFT_1127552 [Trametes polyzona]|nr:hypothetical protein C8Q77DRAFT_1127552 [Trametes polyzona]